MDPENTRRPRSQHSSPEAYWLRRVFALVGLLVVVGLIAWAASGFGGQTQQVNPIVSRSSAAAAPAPQPTVTVTVTVTALPAGFCADGDVEVKLLADRETYAAGIDPTFTIYVVNTGDTACKRDVGSKQLSLRVLSEGGLVWDSDHCGDAKSDVRMLRPDEEYSSSVTWDGTASAPGCAGGGAKVEPGTYQLVGQASGVSSDDLTFYLR